MSLWFSFSGAIFDNIIDFFDGPPPRPQAMPSSENCLYRCSSLLQLDQHAEKMKGAWRLTVPSSKLSNGNKNIGRLRAQARKQALAMAEVCRQENRENLRQATQITVAMDESKYRKDHTFPLRSAKQPHRPEPLAPRRRELCPPRRTGVGAQPLARWSLCVVHPVVVMDPYCRVALLGGCPTLGVIWRLGEGGIEQH